jgi:rubrerythrin
LPNIAIGAAKRNYTRPLELRRGSAVLKQILPNNYINGGYMKNEQLNQLLYEALETEMGGIHVYETAIRCAVNKDLKEEWEEYHEQTQKHEQIVRDLFGKLGLDPEKETPGRQVVRHIGESLVKAMKMALEAGKPEAAQIVAAECVVEAETKDHLNWELISQVAEKSKGEDRKALKDALEQVEKEEDEHLYHTTGWARELWIESLGLPAVIPPPEEEKDVKTAIGAARAKQARKEML